MVKSMTQGQPMRLILAFCIPLLVGNLFQQFYNMADSIIVGHYVGVNAFAAVGTTGSLSFLVIGFVLGVCSGFSIPVSQDFGAGDEASMRKCVANSIYLAVAIAAVLTVATMLTTRQILRLVHTPEDIFEDAYAYIFIIFAGMGATMLYNLLAGFLRALGDSRTPLLFLVVACLTNIALDLVFIAGLHTGVAGAAWATVLSQAVSGVLCLFYIAKKFPILRLTRADLKPDPAVMLRLLKSGVPMGLQFSLTAVGSIILQSAVNTLGSSVVAAITAAGKVQMIVTMPMETLGITMATYCGQNLGAGRIDRVRKGVAQATWAVMGYTVLAFLTMALVGGKIALLFINASETAILAQIQHFLFINACFFPVLSLIFIYRNSLQGMGYSSAAMFAGIFEMAGRSLVAFAFVGAYGFAAACFANPAAWVFADLLLVPVYIVVMRRLNRQYRALHPKGT